MESLTKPISLEKIAYPVFRLGTEQPKFSGGVVYYANQYLSEDGENTYVLKIIDDANIPAPTLAKRRLKLMEEGVKLKRLTRAVFFLGDLIKLAKSSLWFIDSEGTVFRYQKSTRYKLEFRKIKTVRLIPTGGAIIEVEGIASRFKCLYAPQPTEIYAGVLRINLGYILYGVYDTQYQDTWRMV